MAHLVGIWAAKIGAFIHRFFTEVIASVLTTACVAGVTTVYLHTLAIVPSAPEGARPSDIAPLLSPVADAGAPVLIPPKPVATIMEPALQPRQAGSAAAVAQIVGGAKSVEAKSGEAKPLDPKTAKPLDASFATPVIVADAPKIFDIDAPPEPDPGLFLEPGPSGSQPSPGAVTASYHPRPEHQDRRLLGLRVPDALPSNDDVVRGVKGIGAAVGSLLP